MSAARSRPSGVAGLKRGMAAVDTAGKNTPPGGTDLPAASTTPPRRPRPEKPVRFTLDLDRAHHQALKNYAVSIEARGAAEVIRALLDELHEDPELADRVRNRVWRGR